MYIIHCNVSTKMLGMDLLLKSIHVSTVHAHAHAHVYMYMYMYIYTVLETLFNMYFCFNSTLAPVQMHILYMYMNCTLVLDKELVNEIENESVDPSESGIRGGRGAGLTGSSLDCLEKCIDFLSRFIFLELLMTRSTLDPPPPTMVTGEL